MTREIDRLLRDQVIRTGRIDGRDWEAHCPCCQRVTGHPTALLAHRSLKRHYNECAA